MNLSGLYHGARIGVKLIKSKITGKPVPVWAWTYITNRCNLDCKYCFVAPYWDDAKDLSLKEIKKIIDEQKELGIEMVSLLGGEPTIRKDFGEIVSYIYSKNMLVDVITNGYFIEKWKDSLKYISSICVSLDGNEEITDEIRGKGAYAMAIKAIEIAKQYGCTVRIHGVLTKKSMQELPYMAQLSKKYNISFTCAIASIHRNEDLLRVSDSEIKQFFTEYLRMKRAGINIGHTEASIKTFLEWPYPYFKILEKKDMDANKKVIKCVMKDFLILLGGTGELYPCTVKYSSNGYDVRKLGLKKAYEKLKEEDSCYACSDLSCINLTLIISFAPEIIKETIVKYIREYVKNER